MRWITCAKCKKVTNRSSQFYTFNTLKGETIKGEFCSFCEKDISLRYIPQVRLTLFAQVEYKRPQFEDVSSLIPFPKVVFIIINEYYNLQFDLWTISLDELSNETVKPFYKIKQLRVAIQDISKEKRTAEERLNCMKNNEIKMTPWQTPTYFWEKGLHRLVLNQDRNNDLFHPDAEDFLFWQEVPLFSPKPIADQILKEKKLSRALHAETSKLEWLEKNIKNTGKINHKKQKIQYIESCIAYKHKTQFVSQVEIKIFFQMDLSLHQKCCLFRERKQCKKQKLYPKKIKKYTNPKPIIRYFAWSTHTFRNGWDEIQILEDDGKWHVFGTYLGKKGKYVQLNKQHRCKEAIQHFWSDESNGYSWDLELVQKQYAKPFLKEISEPDQVACIKRVSFCRTRKTKKHQKKCLYKKLGRNPNDDVLKI